MTFTLEATDEGIALLEAVQYLDYGPCVQAAEGNEELLDEGPWQMFAHATAAYAVRTTLTHRGM